MYCKKCGNEIGEYTKFCTKCGASNEYYSPMTSRKSDYKKKALLLAGVVGFVLIVICFSQIFNSYNKSIRIAKQYIKEGEYNKAIGYLNGAEKYNNKKLKAYELEMEAYSCLPGGAGNVGATYCEAIRNCKNVSKLTDDVLRIAQKYVKNGNSVAAMHVLKEASREDGDEQIKNEWLNISRQVSSNILQLIYPVVENFDIEALKNEILQEKYVDFVLNVPEDFEMIYIPGDSGDFNGIGIGIYYIERSTSNKGKTVKNETVYNADDSHEPRSVGNGNIAIYYGDYKNGERSGTGKLVAISNENEYSIFDGEWSSDMPNGYGTVRTMETGYDSAETMTGNVANGLWDGQVIKSGGFSSSTWQFEFTNGIPYVYGYSEGSVVLGKQPTGGISCYDIETKDQTWGVFGYCEYEK